MSIKIKICGLRKRIEFETLCELNLDYAGLVFYSKSLRYISPQLAKDTTKNLDKKLKLIGVLVDPSDYFLEEILDKVELYGIQLHGNETVTRVREIKKRTNLSIIKAISVLNEDDIFKAEKYEDVADMLLFDSKPDKNSRSPGGNAKSFDWSLLKKRNWSKPWFLSGGLRINNIKNALEKTNTNFLDISSGVEKIKGVKDITLIKNFIQEVKEFKHAKSQ